MKYPSVEKLLSFKLFLLIFGALVLARCCVIKQNITTHLALHVLAYSQKSKEFKLCSLTVPSFRGLPMLVETANNSDVKTANLRLARGTVSYLRREIEKPRTIVISKRKPAPFEQQRVSVPIEEQEQKCLSVCAIRCRECVKRVLLFPRLERKTQAANDVRPSAHMMWHEQRTGVTCSTRVPGVFATFCGQKVEKERLQNEYTIKEVRLKTAEEYYPPAMQALLSP